MSTPGFRVCKPDASVLQLVAPSHSIEPAFNEAVALRNTGAFKPTEQINAHGFQTVSTSHRPVPHQAATGPGTVQFTAWVMPHVRDYMQRNFMLPSHSIPIKSQEVYTWYDVGSALDEHCDDGGGARTHHRFLTVLCYLNGDFEGGALCLPQHCLRIKPSGRLVVMFPGNSRFMHSVEPILRGQRYGLMQSWKF